MEDKYYLISVQEVNDGTNPCAIFVYDSEDGALSAYHSTLASNYISTTLNSFLCMIINANGMIIRTENWKKPIE